MRVWLDTDLGSDVDDALALAYLLRHPAFDLVGVSTVFGDVALRTRMVDALLDLAGAPSIPVLSGLGKPLTPHRKGVMFGHEGLGLLPDAEAAPRLRIEAEAEGGADRVHAIADAMANARPDVVVAIGPLTNLGALAAGGQVLPRLAIMGGKVQDVMLPGMTPAISEWNWWCDPLAVQHVLAASHAVAPRVVPAEVTFRTALQRDQVDALRDGDALCRTLHRLCEEWLRAQSERLGAKAPRVMLHDPLTAATLADPSLCQFTLETIAVDDDAVTSRGAGARVEVACDVDALAAQHHLLSAWTGARV